MRIKTFLASLPEKIKAVLLGSGMTAQEEQELTERKIIGLFKLGKTPAEIASFLSIPISSVYPVLSQAHTGRKKKNPRSRKARVGRLAQWQAMHPAIDVPENYKELSALTGIKESHLKYEIKRRKEKFNQWLRLLGERPKEDFFVYTTENKKIYTKFIRSWKFFYNPFKNRACAEITLPDQSSHVVPIQDRWTFQQAWLGRGAFKPEPEQEQS